uniref:Uncharacterized protein n=1 Tax=Panagrolaimus superbus TaxID=310955 RepID=A0A914YH79_9BILA
MNPSDTLLKQIDLAAQHQKEHHNDHSGIMHDIKESVKEGVKDVIDIVKGKDSETDSPEHHSKIESSIPPENAVPKDNIRQFNADSELRNETLGASV